MTPAEESYAAAWLSEMWSPVAEYHLTRDYKKVAAAAGLVDCDSCGVVFEQSLNAPKPYRWCHECVAASSTARASA